MLLFVGLGNPGPGYAENRHNLGFMVVDEIVHRHGFGAWRSRFSGLVSEGVLGDERVLALKPLTYMNESGRSVGEAVRYLKVPVDQVIVFHDELDLASGKMRVKKGGGHAGHNGLRSIHAHIGPDYRRVRIGVDHPGDRDYVQRWLLSDFAKSEVALRDKMIDAIAEAAPLLAAGDEKRFASKVALLVNPRPEKPARPEPSRPDEPEERSAPTPGEGDGDGI